MQKCQLDTIIRPQTNIHFPQMSALFFENVRELSSQSPENQRNLGTGFIRNINEKVGSFQILILKNQKLREIYHDLTRLCPNKQQIFPNRVGLLFLFELSNIPCSWGKCHSNFNHRFKIDPPYFCQEYKKNPVVVVSRN